MTFYHHDAAGALTRKVAPGQVFGTVYVGGIYEKNVDTGGVTKYYYADGKRIAMRSASTVSHLVQDHLGGTAATQWATVASTFQRTRYYPYGMLRSGSPATDKLFTGQQRETTNGIYHYGARMYNADIGRFISADTIGVTPDNPQKLNRYSYVLNNPVRYNDPSGHRYEDGWTPNTDGTHPPGGGTPPPDSPPTHVDEIYCGSLECVDWMPAGWNCYSLTAAGSNCFAPGHPKYENPAGCLCLGFMEIYAGGCAAGDAVGIGLACDFSDPALTAYLCATGKCTIFDVAAAFLPVINSGQGRLLSGLDNVSDARRGIRAADTDYRLTPYATQRMVDRGISDEQAIEALETGETFAFFHDVQLKTGHYKESSGILVVEGETRGEVINVLGGVKRQYIDSLMRRQYGQ